MPGVFSKRLRGGGATQRNHWNGFSAPGFSVPRNTHASGRLWHCSARAAAAGPGSGARPKPPAAPRGPAHTTAAAQRDFLASEKREPPS